MKNRINTTLVSFIVPVYNAEQTIKQTIDSILKQTRYSWELILINDGSTDQSLNICKQYSNLDARIEVYDLPNQGVSKARNAGIIKAKGKYITFIDSDDWIDSNLLANIEDNLKEDIDLLFYGCSTDYVSTYKLSHSQIKTVPQMIQFHSKQIATYWGYMFRTLNMESCWNKLFRKDIIINNNILFNENMIVFEDFVFLIKYMHNVKNNIILIPFIGYHYNSPISYNPIQRRNNKNLYPSINIAIDELSNWIEELNLNQYDKNTFFSILVDKFFLLTKNIKIMPYNKSCKEIINNIANNNVFKQYNEGMCKVGGGYFRLANKLLKIKAYYLYFLFSNFKK